MSLLVSPSTQSGRPKYLNKTKLAQCRLSLLPIILWNRPEETSQNICVKLEILQSSTWRRRLLSMTMLQNWIKWDIKHWRRLWGEECGGRLWRRAITEGNLERNYKTQFLVTFTKVNFSFWYRLENEDVRLNISAQLDRPKAVRKEQIETIKSSKVNHCKRKQIIHFAFIKLYHYILKLINMKMETRGGERENESECDRTRWEGAKLMFVLYSCLHVQLCFMNSICAANCFRFDRLHRDAMRLLIKLTLKYSFLILFAEVF